MKLVKLIVENAILWIVSALLGSVTAILLLNQIPGEEHTFVYILVGVVFIWVWFVILFRVTFPWKDREPPEDEEE